MEAVKIVYRIMPDQAANAGRVPGFAPAAFFGPTGRDAAAAFLHKFNGKCTRHFPFRFLYTGSYSLWSL